MQYVCLHKETALQNALNTTLLCSESSQVFIIWGWKFLCIYTNCPTKRKFSHRLKFRGSHPPAATMPQAFSTKSVTKLADLIAYTAQDSIIPALQTSPVPSEPIGARSAYLSVLSSHSLVVTKHYTQHMAGQWTGHTLKQVCIWMINICRELRNVVNTAALSNCQADIQQLSQLVSTQLLNNSLVSRV